MEAESQVSHDVRFITLLDASLRLRPDQRESFLGAACAAEPALLATLIEQLHWEERMGDFLLEPLVRRPAVDHPFQPGDFAAGRFRIIREVGRGGMGVIYEAVDERLGQRRALKCARPGFQERLPPEARAAMRVTHDNICRVYEIHTAETEQGTIDILAMEFLEGETLAARIRGQGPLAPPEAVHVLRQLVLGLSAAHKQSLLHRDLKSSNVMLTPEGRVVIMDFGLARDSGLESELCLTSELRGAPPYIAPELWKGAAASVASDLYALGSIAHEMVTGRHPFPADAPMEQRLTQTPAGPKSHNPALDRMWDRVVLRCLQPEPAQRFKSAEQLMEALAPPSRRNVWIPMAAVSAIALLAVYALRPTAPSTSSLHRLTILPLRATGCENAPIGGVLFDVSDRLQRLQGLVSIPLAEAIRKNVTNASAAVAKLGATHVLEAGARCLADKFEVETQIIDAHSSIALRRLSGTYSAATLGVMSTAIVGAVTAAFKLPPARWPETVSAGAYPSYAQGIDLLRNNKRSADRAIPLFQQAAASDPQSALPLTGLTEAYLTKYRSTNDRQWLARAREALRDAESRNPDSAAVHFVSGGLSRASGSWDQAAESYRRALQLEPWNGDVWNHLAITYGAMQGRQADAGQAFAKAIQLQPGYFEPHVDFAIFYFRLGDYANAEAQFQLAIQLAPGNGQFHSDLCGVYTVMANFGKAAKSCRQAIELNPTAPAFNNLGAILAYEDRDKEALAEYRKAIQLEPNKYSYFQNTGDSLRRLGLSAEAQKEYRTGKDLAAKALRENPTSAQARSFAGYFAIRLNNLESGSEEMEQALRLAPDNAPVMRNAVLAYEAIQRRERVFAILRNAPSALVRELDRHPDLKGLRQDARFLELLRK